MRSCSHCGADKSPCWRRGPPEKRLLCNACGAHFLVKKSLDDGYMPGQRASSSGSSQRKRRQHHPQHLDDISNNTGSTASAGSSLEQDNLEVEQPSVIRSQTRSRLVACSVFETDAFTPSQALCCKRTFATADGGVMTVVRRMRKQLKPRAASCST